MCATPIGDESDEVFDAHKISFHPVSGVKAMADRCSYMKLRLNPAAL